MAAFIDEARIFVGAGKGGNGCESFYSDKRTRYPRPDGGDGGRGGDVIIVASRSVQTLLDYKFRQHHKAHKGGHAGSKGKTGRRGQDCILKVPIGTIIRDQTTNLIIKDLTRNEQQVIVAKGGSGGIGNNHNRTPKPAQEGEKRTLYLELKIVADVGIIGFPNVGKSTLISAVSKVHSKIANYPFTTKQPILGFVEQQDEDFNFVIADLPGLIEGAHLGKGLGYRFLKHAERTRILVHVIDMGACEGRDPFEDYEKINYELKSYSSKLHLKKQIIVANKMDLAESSKNLKKFRRKYRGEILAVSAAEKTGLESLINKIKELLCQGNFQEQ